VTATEHARDRDVLQAMALMMEARGLLRRHGYAPAVQVLDLAYNLTEDASGVEVNVTIVDREVTS
jgi:hypothetical protein